MISVDTLRKYVTSQDRYLIIDGTPHDENRVDVNPHDIEQYHQNLDKIVSSFPASLVFNMDEYIDTHSMRFIVPYEYTNPIINILVHCICADGHYLKPLIIIPRKTLDNVILERL